MSGSWGPWIEHDGKSCPPAGTICWVANAAGMENEICVEIEPNRPNAFIWASLTPKWHLARIVRYRLRRPPALQQLIDLVENLPAPVREREDA